MRRRTFIAGLASSASLPLAAHAQSSMPVIGYLSGLSEGDRPALLETFHQGLAVAGYAVGRNVAIEYRYANNRMDRLPALVADLVKKKVAVIVATGGNNPGLIAKSITSTVPIVFTSGVDPVKAGLVESLSRPGANITGVSFFTVELGAKHIELMRELVPHTSLVGLMLNRNNPESVTYEQLVQDAARAFKLPLLVQAAATPDEIERAFAAFARKRSVARWSEPIPTTPAKPARSWRSQRDRHSRSFTPTGSTSRLEA
jgi:putative tryptophan/tyrosine transport system substrate-binding protein